jgi:hypothetical protein
MIKAAALLGKTNDVIAYQALLDRIKRFKMNMTASGS